MRVFLVSISLCLATSSIASAQQNAELDFLNKIRKQNQAGAAKLAESVDDAIRRAKELEQTNPSRAVELLEGQLRNLEDDKLRQKVLDSLSEARFAEAKEEWQRSHAKSDSKKRPSGIPASFRLDTGRTLTGELISISKRQVEFLAGKTKFTYPASAVPVVALRDKGAYFYVPKLMRYTFVTYDDLKAIRERVSAAKKSNGNSDWDKIGKQMDFIVKGVAVTGLAVGALWAYAEETGQMDALREAAGSTSAGKKSPVGVEKRRETAKRDDSKRKEKPKSASPASTAGVNSFVTGTVYYKNGKPAPNIRVGAQRSEGVLDLGGGDFVKETRTDSKGRFTLRWNTNHGIDVFYLDGDDYRQYTPRNTDVRLTLKR